MRDDDLQIRSFRVVFDLERRIHRVDRFRIPLPYGLPVRGIGYFVLALAAVLVATGIPIVGELVGLLPAPARLVALPVAAAYVLTRVHVDGRAAHETGLAWLQHLWRPRRLVGFRPAPPVGVVRLGDLTCVPDDRGIAYRPARLEGPSEVLLRAPFTSRLRRGTLLIDPAPGDPLLRGRRLLLEGGQRARIT